jgi:hypothetical protein
MPTTVAGVQLRDDEEVLHDFRPSWAAWFWSICLTFGFWIPVAWWQRQGIRYIVTDERVIRKRGRLGSTTNEFRLADVARLETGRSFGERIFGSGTIILDTGVDELRMKAVPNHTEVAATIRSGQTG